MCLLDRLEVSALHLRIVDLIRLMSQRRDDSS